MVVGASPQCCAQIMPKSSETTDSNMPTLAPSDDATAKPRADPTEQNGGRRGRGRADRNSLIARGIILAIISGGAVFAAIQVAPRSQPGAGLGDDSRPAGRWLPNLDSAVPGAVPWAAATDGGTVESSAGLPPPVRIDAGGSGISSHGRVWAADAGFTGGQPHSVTQKIAGTQVGTLFTSERVGVVGYAVPVPVPGKYIVRVYAAETEATKSGQRIFSISAEGAPIAKDIDLFASAGRGVATVFSRSVAVHDGVVNIAFTAKKGDSVASAIEVLAVPASKAEQKAANSGDANRAIAQAPAGGSTDDPGTEIRGGGGASTGGGGGGGAAADAAGGTLAVRFFGEPRSGLPWHSGFWTGGYKSTGRMEEAGAWRGRPFDVATTYATHSTWAGITENDFAASTFKGFDGVLAYGLPMLPDDRRGQWGDVTSGAHDGTFRTIARQLVANGHGDAAVRIGWEANGDWFPWAVTNDTAPQYIEAFRRIVSVMRDAAPNLTFWQDLSAGTALTGGSNRMDPLTKLYAGDDFVDGISVDHYDFYSVKAKTETEWKNALRPKAFFGIQDAADFARAKGKGFAVPEWGLHGQEGYGDNAFFIKKMFGFFEANKDVLVFENYFNEPDAYIESALWDADQNPQASAEYRKMFGN